MCDECNSEINEVWTTSTQSGNVKTTTTHTRSATVCSLCDLAAKEFMKAKAKRATMIGGIAILVSALVGVAFSISTGNWGSMAIVLVGFLIMWILNKRKNIYKGRRRTGGKDIEVLKMIVERAGLPKKELKIAKTRQKIGFFMARFNNFPNGRMMFFIVAALGALNLLMWALDFFMLDGDMFAEAWIAIMFLAFLAIPAILIVPAYFSYMPKALKMRMKINKVRKHIGLEEVEYKAAMFSKEGGDEKKEKKVEEPKEEGEKAEDKGVESKSEEKPEEEAKEEKAEEKPDKPEEKKEKPQEEKHKE